MNDFMDLLKVAGIGIAITFINKILKTAGRDTEASIVSLIGIIIALMIAVGYIMQFFDVMQTMFMF